MSAAERSNDFDAIVVGAGFAGLYMLHRLRGLGLTVRVFEAGDGVGGTWYWNRYPGARCDVDSMEYSYQFSEELQQEWEWSERFSPQPEILEYLNHVADRFDLRRDIVFGTRVTAAAFDEAAGRWVIETDAGDVVSAAYYVMATGCLSSTNKPRIDGLETFAGETYHTGEWPHEGVDFTGTRVGVIGTGSSAIQSIPLIAAEADHVYVFQRTPNYSIPARNGPIDPEYVREIKSDYPSFRAENAQFGFGLRTHSRDVSALEVTPEEREREFEARWSQGGLPFLSAFNDIGMSEEANAYAREFLHRKIRGLVEDPETARLLSPDTTVGCKRLCVDSDYFATFNRANVTLVDVRSAPIERITATGLRTSDAEYAFDRLVLATGFDAMTGALLKVDIRGVGGQSLRDKWAEGPRTYLGLGTAGFPNFFTITGPGSPSVLSNMVPSIEQHVNWIADCIQYLRDQGLHRIEAQADAEEAWVAHVNEVASQTLYTTCNSWYLGANVPGKPRVFMPYLGFPPYVEKCSEVAAKGYEGFALS
jgi:cation diffusion facilitator CzcD-associated flavoprotein CzcO